MVMKSTVPLQVKLPLGIVNGKRMPIVIGRLRHEDCFERFGGPKRKGASKDVTEKAAVVGHGGKLMVDKGTVEGVAINVFCDPGCTTVLVKRTLVPKHKFTGKYVDLKMANKQVFRYPEAIVDVVSPYFTGETLDVCMPDPIYDLVIGAIDGSTDGLSTEVRAVTTRLQNQMQEKKLKGPSKLKVKEVINLMQKENKGKLQAEDGMLKKVFEHAKSNRAFVKNENKSHCFVIKKGTLYCRVQNEGIINDQLVVPDKLRHAVIELAHDSLMSGHLGIQKTTAHIQSNFYWPGMSVQITRFCRSCDACQRTVDKGRIKKVKLGRMPLIQEPFQCVAVDIVGPIEPRASDGSRYILTILDYATRYPEAVALKNIDSVTVAEALLSVFSQVGIPKEVLSDRGTQFTSEGWEEHRETLRLVLDILSKALLTAKPSKSEIGYFSVEYLGSKIGNGISRTAEDKVSKILNVDTPKTKRQVKSFLDLTGYYRHYIPDYATIAAPLTDLIKKSQPNVVDWSLCHQESFVMLKNILSSHPIVRLPDLTKDFVLPVDASNVGLGAILMQYVDGERWPVQYASRKLKGAEQNYSVIEKECLAVVWAVKKFYQYLYGKAFVIESDHQPLKYLNSAGHINSRLMRWAMYLQQFEYTIHNIPGKENVGPDCLSRF
ncbi:uncharacterized protein [Palaemon carinicauda]|uniref:uncharacterized protein n=1 Tax=Palaemon carinicauda TaxID=392227 RepID=UPI0035B687D1